MAGLERGSGTPNSFFSLSRRNRRVGPEPQQQPKPSPSTADSTPVIRMDPVVFKNLGGPNSNFLTIKAFVDFLKTRENDRPCIIEGVHFDGELHHAFGAKEESEKPPILKNITFESCFFHANRYHYFNGDLSATHLEDCHFEKCRFDQENSLSDRHVNLTTDWLHGLPGTPGGPDIPRGWESFA